MRDALNRHIIVVLLGPNHELYSSFGAMADEWRAAIAAHKRTRAERGSRGDTTGDPKAGGSASSVVWNERCTLLEVWLEDFAFEALPAVAIQRYASRAVQDGFTHPRSSE